MRRPAFSFLLAGLLLCARGAPAGGASEARLEALGVAPDGESIARYLSARAPDADAHALATSLVAWITEGGGDRRDSALRILLRHPKAGILAVKQTQGSPDPETRRFVSAILARLRAAISQDDLHAALRVVRNRRLEGLAGPVLDVVPLCFEPHTRQAGVEALRAAAREEDVPLLRRALRHSDLDVRAAALIALGDLVRDDSLRPFLDDPDARIRLAAAHARAQQGHADAVQALLDLLDDPDEHVRAGAAHLLRSLSGHRLGFDELDPIDRRRKAAALWRARAERTDWTGLLGRRIATEVPRKGRILISRMRSASFFTEEDSDPLTEMDAKGRCVWSCRLPGSPWCCVGLPDGRRVAACTSGPVVAYDREGAEEWRYQGDERKIHSVSALRNGNLLLAATAVESRLVEVQPPGEAVWTLRLDGGPAYAEELESGRLLVVFRDAGRVVEMDREGRIFWSLDGLDAPYSAQRLPEGNTLVCEAGAHRVVEFAPDGSLVRTLPDLSRCFRAQPLASGRILIAEWRGVAILHPDGRKEWLEEGFGQGWVCGY